MKLLYSFLRDSVTFRQICFLVQPAPLLARCRWLLSRLARAACPPMLCFLSLVTFARLPRTFTRVQDYCHCFRFHFPTPFDLLLHPRRWSHRRSRRWHRSRIWCARGQDRCHVQLPCSQISCPSSSSPLSLTFWCSLIFLFSQSMSWLALPAAVAERQLKWNLVWNWTLILCANSSHWKRHFSCWSPSSTCQLFFLALRESPGTFNFSNR